MRKEKNGAETGIRQSLSAQTCRVLYRPNVQPIGRPGFYRWCRVLNRVGAFVSYLVSCFATKKWVVASRSRMNQADLLIAFLRLEGLRIGNPRQLTCGDLHCHLSS